MKFLLNEFDEFVDVGVHQYVRLLIQRRRLLVHDHQFGTFLKNMQLKTKSQTVKMTEQLIPVGERKCGKVSGGRDAQRRAQHDEQIGRLRLAHRRLQLLARQILAEAHDRIEQRPSACKQNDRSSVTAMQFEA